jgi:hypothetical protein
MTNTIWSLDSNGKRTIGFEEQVSIPVGTVDVIADGLLIEREITLEVGAFDNETNYSCRRLGKGLNLSEKAPRIPKSLAGELKKRSAGVCEDCDRKRPNLLLHHVRHRRPVILLDIAVICGDCHQIRRHSRLFHFIDEMAMRAWKGGRSSIRVTVPFDIRTKVPWPR